MKVGALTNLGSSARHQNKAAKAAPQTNKKSHGFNKTLHMPRHGMAGCTHDRGSSRSWLATRCDDENAKIFFSCFFHMPIRSTKAQFETRFRWSKEFYPTNLELCFYLLFFFCGRVSIVFFFRQTTMSLLSVVALLLGILSAPALASCT